MRIAQSLLWLDFRMEWQHGMAICVLLYNGRNRFLQKRDGALGCLIAHFYNDDCEDLRGTIQTDDARMVLQHLLRRISFYRVTSAHQRKLLEGRLQTGH